MSKTVSLFSALLCTFIWGTTFIAQDTGMDDIGPFTFNAVRFFVGFLAIVPFAFIFEVKKFESEFRLDFKTFAILSFLIGLFFQVIILPIVALIIVFFWPLTPELAIGVMILAAAPGGVTSNVLTSYARGNIALSISLIAINSILCVITVPVILIISLSLLGYGALNEGQSLLNVAFQMFLIVTMRILKI